MAGQRLRMLGPRIASADVRVAAMPAKVADGHYSTPEHRAWAKRVIARAGGRCQDPGCREQGAAGKRLFADHVVELRDGGAALDVANGMARCGACHSRKTAQARAARMARPT